MSDTQEILLRENPNRYVIFPIKYPKLWKKYQDAVATFWVPEEVSEELSKERGDWDKLSDNERHFLKHVLAFFAGSDGIVIENLAERFMKEIQIPEARHFYTYQLFIEGIHSTTYSLLIDYYVKDEKEKNRLFCAIETIPCVAKKANWAVKWIKDQKANFATRLVGFAAVEGIFFSGSFCAIYWLKSRGLCPALTFSNELISRDEGMHTDFAVELYSMLENKLSQETIHKIIKESVEIEKEFIINSIPCNLIGMNSELMSQYIEFVADRLVVQLVYKIIWNKPNPFEFMEMISLAPKANFFEKKNSQYIKSGVGKTQEERSFSLEADF